MSDLVQTSVLLPSELHDWLRAEAFRQRTSMSRLITQALNTYRRAETGDRGGV